jgi:lipoprotein-releasing system permease protein
MSGLSIGGLIFGTALLLTVLSVMNGFEREMRERILALVPHVTVHTAGDARELDRLAEELGRAGDVRDVTRFVSFDGIALRNGAVTAVSGLGLDRAPALGDVFADLPLLDDLSGVILGDSVAAVLNSKAGDYVTLIVPRGPGFGEADIGSERLRVVAVVDTGTELDEALALVSLQQASALAGLDGGVSGLQLRYADPFAVDAKIPSLRRTLPPGSYATTWRMTHGNLYAAISLSRDLVTLLLTSIIGVAAFNVVSALVLIVIDQRGAIAILRTLGVTPGAMAGVFVAQGLLIGVIGSVLGCALGAVLATFLPDIVAALETGIGVQFLQTDVYPVSFIPVDLRLADVATIASVAVLMCVVAALYPALRAARLAPAEVLSQDV